MHFFIYNVRNPGAMGEVRPEKDLNRIATRLQGVSSDMEECLGRWCQTAEHGQKIRLHAAFSMIALDLAE